MSLILIAIGVLVILALAGYAYYLHKKIQLRDQQRAEWRRELEEMVEERTDRITKSILVIANATLEEQMSLSESCLRLSALLNQLGVSQDDERYQAIHKAAAELEHIPILQEWKALKFSQRMSHLKEMEKVESVYGDFVLECCRVIQVQGVTKPDLSPSAGGVGIYQP